MLESTRAKEAAVNKETSEQLEAFRKQRQAADAALLTEPSGGQAESTAQVDTWASQKKRRRGHVKPGSATKLRKLSSSDPKTVDEEKASRPSNSPKSSPNLVEPSDRLHKDTAQVDKTPKNHVANLGLGGYSSEDD